MNQTLNQRRKLKQGLIMLDHKPHHEVTAHDKRYWLLLCLVILLLLI